MLNFDQYVPLSEHYTLLMHAQGGLNLHYKNNIMNEFSIGGMTDQFLFKFRKPRRS